MDKAEPTFVPEWLKSSGGLSTTSHQSTFSSLHNDEQGVAKSLRNKSLVISSDNDLGRTSISDRTTSSYFRRASSISNDSSHFMSSSSFGRNHRDSDWDKDVYEFRNKEKSANRHRDYSDPIGNILAGRFEKDGLRRSHSSLSGKRGDSWTRKSASDLSIANKSGHNNGSALVSGGSSVSIVKTSFERDFPSLGADEKQVEPDTGRVPSPGLSSAIQSLPIGSSAVIGGDGWTSALAEVPVIVGSNGSGTSVALPVQATSISATTSMTGCRNMAETLAQGPPRSQTAPQLTVGTQRLEELAVKQSRQLIPMTPMPKAMALNSSDKSKLKVGQSQLQSCHLGNHLRPITLKSGGKLLVLKPSSHGISPIPKEASSPTSGGKLPNSPLAVMGNSPGIGSKPRAEKSQAESRNNFFNLVRKKSMTSSAEKAPSGTGIGIGMGMVNRSKWAQQANESRVDLGGKNHSGVDAILYSEEEEARFLRSLGWDESAEEEEEGLTEEEISSFYRSYLNIKAGETKVMMANAKVDG